MFEKLVKTKQGEENPHNLQVLYFSPTCSVTVELSHLCEIFINRAQELATRGKAQVVPVLQNNEA